MLGLNIQNFIKQNFFFAHNTWNFWCEFNQTSNVVHICPKWRLPIYNAEIVFFEWKLYVTRPEKIGHVGKQNWSLFQSFFSHNFLFHCMTISQLVYNLSGFNTSYRMEILYFSKKIWLVKQKGILCTHMPGFCRLSHIHIRMQH